MHPHQGHIQHYHVPAPVTPSPAPSQQQAQAPPTTVAPSDTYNNQQAPQPAQPQTPQQQASGSGPGPHTPLVAQGDWTKNLVHLAKTAELKKHALTLQLHTAHILSAHATLESKNKALQDIKEQKNRLDSERARLLQCLREVHEDKDKADLMEAQINEECTVLKQKIQTITDGEYSTAKREVDALRAELGQPPVPSLQQTLDEKSSAYLNERRINGASEIADTTSTPTSTVGNKRAVSETAGGVMIMDTPGKRPRGRPKGSKNKNKTGPAASDAGPSANGTGAS